ncbi:ribitol-5-phosphate dehydrogenase [Dellaglioa sp. L3N]
MLNQVYRLVSERQFESVTVEENIENHIIVRPLYLSICHADQRYFTGSRGEKILKKKLPMALIHEGIGEVVRDDTGMYQVGDKVVMIPNTPIEKNDIIDENYLKTSKFRSSGFDGFMQEYVFLNHDRVVPLPAGIDLTVAAFTEMVTVAMEAVTRLQRVMNRDHESIGIWGDGNLGYISAIIAKKLFPDSKVYIFGRHDYKLNYFSFADETFNVDSIPDELEISQAIECTGGDGSKIAIEQIIDHIKPEGTIALMGVSETAVPINTRMVLERGLTLLGSSRSSRLDFEKTVQFLKDNKDAQNYLKNLIGMTLDVSSIEEAVSFFEEDLANSWGKSVMRWRV